MTTRPARNSLVTPLDPGAARRFRPDPQVPVPAQETTLTTAFARIDVAVASACGTHHAVNEDAHSSLANAVSLFVVADGVGGGAMAELASRELVAHLHASLDAHRIEPERIDRAVLDADRVIARRIAEFTDAPGAATMVLCTPADAFASRWLVAWVGDCRAYRLALDGRGFEQLTRDDTFGALNEEPPPGGSATTRHAWSATARPPARTSARSTCGRNDLLVLCSDGVHKHLDAADWCGVLGLRDHAGAALRGPRRDARAHGSVDDATVLLVHRTRLPAIRPRGIDRSADPGDGARSDR